MKGRARAPRRTAFSLSLGAGLVVAALKATAFVPAFRSAAAGNRAGRSPSTALRAEGEKEGEGDGGFLKFLKVEQDIELSPEEYTMALEAEIEEQRKRYYINGVVKEGNLIVPWKGIDEKALVKDARRRLRKNGIKDPAGEGVDEDEADSEITLQLIGSQDVVIDWAAGVPGQKVGYIVERKSSTESNFVEIASYEAQQFAYLLSKPYAGHEYVYTDEIVPPGTWTYRILVRLRTGEVQVVDSKDIAVPELSGVDNQTAGIVFVVIFALSLIGGYLADPAIK